jgi:hypothetical protein
VSNRIAGTKHPFHRKNFFLQREELQKSRQRKREMTSSFIILFYYGLPPEINVMRILFW